MRNIQSGFSLSPNTVVFTTPVKVLTRLLLVLVLVLLSSDFNPFRPAMIVHAIGVTTIPVGHHPIGVVVDPLNDIVYVAANGDNAVNYFSGNAEAPFNVNFVFYPQNVGGPSAMAATQIFSPFLSKRLSVIYVTNQFNSSISIIPRIGFQQPTVSLGKQPAGVDVDSSTNLVYVANFQEGTVSVIPGADGTDDCSKCLTVTATIPVGPLPLGVAVNSMTHRIYVTSNFGNTVSVINGKDNTVGTPITVGNHPYGVAVNPKTNRIYVTNSSDNTVSVIDGVTNAVVATIPVGTTPQGVAVNPTTNDIFVANEGDNTVSVIDGATNTVTRGTQVGHLPMGVAVNPMTNRVYVTNFADNTVSEFLDPGAGQDLITVPVRFCAVQGSLVASDTNGHSFGPEGSPVTDGILMNLLQQVNDQIWLPGAHIIFQPQPYPFLQGHFPVIADPDPPPLGPGQLGDILFTVRGSSEMDQAVNNCKAMWEQPAIAQGIAPLPGIIVVNVRQFVDDLGVPLAPIGGAPTPDPSLYLQSGSRHNDLCTYPRHLTVNDVTSEFAMVIDQHFQQLEGGDPVATLAHELGHTLLLGHGNGLDSDQDGALPPTPGSRLFDDYCDPTGGDPLPPDAPPCGSLMVEASSCTNITPLQREAARDAAVLEPGAVFHHSPGCCFGELLPPPNNPCLHIINCLASVGMSTDVETQTTTFSHTVFGELPPDANNQYTIFADLDNNPASGCAPSTLGFPTAFQGAELVTSVSVRVVDGVRQTVPTVWQCQAGGFVMVINPQISADAFTQTNAENGIALFSRIVIQVPSAVVGATETQVRIQAIAQQLGPGGRTDRLPATAGSGGVISLAPPVVAFPQCALTPTSVHTGDSATVMASGLIANSKADVDLGVEQVATGSIDGSGNARITFVVPRDARTGLRLVTVGVHGTSLTATCSLQVMKVSSALPSPLNIFLLVLLILLTILIIGISLGVYRYRKHSKTRFAKT